MYTNCATQSIYIPEHEGCSDCEVLEQDVEELKGQMADVQETLPEKQDKLTAGEGIFITPDNIISSTSGTFVVTFSNGTADKTISQIINAFDNNMTIIGSDGTSFFPLEDIDKASSRAVFFKMYPQADTALVGSAVVGSSVVSSGEEEFDWERYTVESDNTVTHDTGTLDILKHLVDGVADGSARSTTSMPESGSYALGYGAVAVGNGTSASGSGAFAEGSGTVASGNSAHAEGFETEASGNHSHAGGYQSVASGVNSFAHGDHATAQGADQTVIGSLNVIDTNNEYAFIIGNGNHGGGGSASNAFGVKWDGTLVFANGTTITPAQFADLASLVNPNEQNF